MDIPRTRDCYYLSKGDTFTVVVDDELATNGWLGGQGVQWTPSVKDEFVVTRSTGLYGGFLLNGSRESSDQFIASTGTQPFYKYAVLCSGGWILTTIAYERYTYASRQSGPLVENIYNCSDRLVFSLRGFWTKEDEWTLSGDPRGSNEYFIGSVVQVPTSLNNYYLTIQTSI